MKRLTSGFLLALSSFSFAAFASESPKSAVLTDPLLLNKMGIPFVAQNKTGEVAYALLTPAQQEELAVRAHDQGRCGGFEKLAASETKALSPTKILADLDAVTARDQKWTGQVKALRKDATIQTAVNEVSDENLKSFVEWFSAFPTRYHNNTTDTPQAVNALKQKIEQLVQSSNSETAKATRVELIDHVKTPQKSIRVHIEGKTRASEIIVFGAHMDSINWGSWRKVAPGADDDASGSANLFEMLRILLTQPRLDRSVEIFFYAGEEAGLLGSSEIAADYKAKNQDVIAVLQLDMTLHPGEGEFIFSSMTDFTSPWLRQKLVQLNAAYVGATVKEDKCGYGCSDHASWYRQGYPTLMPFEASFRTMNPYLHTENDTINERSNFKHSAMFSKFAVALAMDLGSSTERATAR